MRQPLNTFLFPIKRIELIVFLTTFLFLTPLLANSQQKADIIIFNGKIITLDRQEQCRAIAISGKKVLYTGSNAEVKKHSGPRTLMIDAGGRTVIPGLFDSHLHVIRGGRFYNAELRWDNVKSVKSALQMLREQAARTPPGQWVRVVGGWSEFQFEERRVPTLEEINDATGNVPTFVLYLYAKAWINKAGLKAVNLGLNAENPPGGFIEKDNNGNPTGLLVAEPNAFILYSTLAKLPELSLGEKLNSTLQFIYELNRLGVTAAMDAGGGFQNFPDDYAITDSLYKSGEINIRLPHYLFAQKKGTELQDYQRWTGLVDIHKHPEAEGYSVAGAGENLVAEAADFENFQYPRPELSTTMEKKLFDVITTLSNKRWPFRLHATYDESISRDLDVIEAVNKNTPLTDLPWFIDHGETISKKNLERIKNLGGGISVQHRMAYQGEHFIRRYGTEAASGTPPLGAIVASKIPVALGTDGTRVASYNPWIALYWAVTGKTVGGTQTLSQYNRLDRFAALTLLTSGGYTLIHENMKGRLVKDFAADLVILNKDYFTVPESEIPGITSVLTIVDGKIVYGDTAVYPFTPVKQKAIPDWSPVNFY